MIYGLQVYWEEVNEHQSQVYKVWNLFKAGFNPLTSIALALSITAAMKSERS